MSHSFPKSLRLLKSSDFSHLREKPQFVSSGLFLFFYKDNLFPSANPEIGTTRIGISVSKKISNRAVKRNYLKRRVREVFRASPYRHLAKDVLVVANHKRFKSYEDAIPLIESSLLAGLKKISDS